VSHFNLKKERKKERKEKRLFLGCPTLISSAREISSAQKRFLDFGFFGSSSL